MHPSSYYIILQLHIWNGKCSFKICIQYYRTTISLIILTLRVATLEVPPRPSAAIVCSGHCRHRTGRPVEDEPHHGRGESRTSGREPVRRDVLHQLQQRRNRLDRVHECRRRETGSENLVDSFYIKICATFLYQWSTKLITFGELHIIVQDHSGDLLLCRDTAMK